MTRFIGRQRELAGLKGLQRKRTSSLVVIRGRRRIGKSRLAEEFSRSFSVAYIFSGVPPAEKVTAKSQRQEFIRQMSEQGVPRFGENNWGDLFYSLAKHTSKGSVLVVLDEITWMGNKDPLFLGVLKINWDLHFKKNPKLILILSGSNSYWIEKNILSSTGFFGRVSYRLTLDELPLHECNEFWQGAKEQVSSHEKFKLLAITGGVPRYLEEINPHLSAEENIRRLCYHKEGLLVHEFNSIFSDIFTKKSERYKAIIQRLANGKATLDEIAHSLGRKRGGDLSESLEDLCEAGFIHRDYSWGIKSQKKIRVSQYRLSDNYVRFYVKYIEPYAEQIKEGTMEALPSGWDSIMGCQFENLVVSNRHRLFDLLGIPWGEILWAAPFLQTKTKQHPKCQIDLLIQTKFNTLYLCEVKFEKQEVSTQVVSEVKERISRLSIPKGFSVRPVLIHVNGVSYGVEAADYFSKIIDFSDLLVK